VNGRVILSLCDVTGVWPGPYADAGYEVRTVDILTGQDVRLMPRPAVPIHGILAAPPCTVFAASGNRWPRTPEDIAAALAVVDACLRLVAVCRPAWWCLENPRGKLSRYLGPPAMRFNPCDFGDPWTKHTCLWGHFTPPRPLFTTPRAVLPSLGSRMHRMAGVRPGDSDVVAASKRTARSATPPGFARAFFEANP
jgi:hypothetical protein